MDLSEYSALDGLDLVERIERREIEPQRVLALALEAAREVNPSINAVVGFAPQEAERAQEADCLTRPMAGLPFLMKDLGATVAGLRQDMGSRLASGFVPDADSELAARYKRAGLAIFGRTNTPEFGLNPSTEPLLHGPTRNPFDPTRSAGGSSGGAAAAVASGIVPIAHGTDGGGSLRCPASACGVFGFKPSRGRMPSGPGADEFGYGIVAEHVITRSVRDSAHMLDLTAGADIGSRLALPSPPTSYREAAGQDPRPLRIAVVTDPPAGGPATDRDCIEATLAAARLCEALGHQVEVATLPVGAEEIASVFGDLHGFAFAGEIPFLERLTGRTADADTLEWASWQALQHGRGMTAVDFERARRLHNDLARRMGRFFAPFDILLSPVLSSPPVPLGFMDANDSALDYRAMTAKFFEIMPFTPIFNLTGQPAMSMPLHMSEGGLPVGVQFAAKLAEEATLFSLAGQIERAAPWRHRRPAIFAGNAAMPS
ncbi:amidase [Kaistia dalseonensis]|uniref:Indoleacetamide hydrolase n=1 Tax=Kaistia dalseonensis TaxID=410840 RepID=A0ABU0H172_9HYPH|nr:amidase [Kaistia dalseonensis]MCX5493499.1 amidase [Kaistia dalseonensis]MDQ0436059.1 amidase [Kaistia dalseonensis]